MWIASEEIYISAVLSSDIKLGAVCITLLQVHIFCVCIYICSVELDVCADFDRATSKMLTNATINLRL